MIPNLIFVHVPKCAGTSVINALATAYKHKVFYEKSFRRYRRHLGWQWQIALPLVPEDEKTLPDGIRMIVGHFTWKKWEHLGWPMFTFLRHPVDRLISQYSIKGTRQKVTFREFIQIAPNSMSRMVGSLNRYSFVGLQEHFDESIEMMEWMSGVAFKRPLRYRNRNRTPKFEPTKKGIRYAASFNKEDMRLYAQAKLMFEKQRELVKWIQS